MLEWIAVGVGGFIGCCLRFGFSKLLSPMGGQFPFVTLLSNTIAGFVVGFFVEFERQSGYRNPKVRLFLITGMMGGLSTFSAFSMETVELFHGERYGLAAGNILLNMVGGFLGVVLGGIAAKLIFRKSLS